ncbi:hypothetical protein O6P43_017159 [Quillaja saponaria]|uniref:Uncharacterized protein n=1 Tax=Quillaja saponaria TaxID=32244 RepID=A0AAD7PP85_QUISA|nr:hypothetical protein O6P43_017159 [Quillaja saponaria]
MCLKSLLQSSVSSGLAIKSNPASILRGEKANWGHMLERSNCTRSQSAQVRGQGTQVCSNQVVKASSGRKISKAAVLFRQPSPVPAVNNFSCCGLLVLIGSQVQPFGATMDSGAAVHRQ